MDGHFIEMAGPIWILTNKHEMLLFMEVDVKYKPFQQGTHFTYFRFNGQGCRTMKKWYDTAHLFVAAIRVWEHQHDAQPSIADICSFLSISPEQGHLIANKLSEVGVVGYIEGAFESKVFIKDHLKIEDIPKDDCGTRLEDEIMQFENSKKHFMEKIESYQSERAQKKKDLFAEMEKKLKKELKK